MCETKLLNHRFDYPGKFIFCVFFYNLVKTGKQFDELVFNIQEEAHQKRALGNFNKIESKAIPNSSVLDPTFCYLEESWKYTLTIEPVNLLEVKRKVGSGIKAERVAFFCRGKDDETQAVLCQVRFE